MKINLGEISVRTSQAFSLAFFVILGSALAPLPATAQGNLVLNVAVTVNQSNYSNHTLCEDGVPNTASFTGQLTLTTTNTTTPSSFLVTGNAYGKVNGTFTECGATTTVNGDTA